MRLQRSRLGTLLLCVLVLPIVFERRAFVLSATATTAATTTALAFWIGLIAILIVKACRWSLLQIVLIVCYSRWIPSRTRSLLWTTLVWLGGAFNLLTISSRLLVTSIQAFVATIASAAATVTSTVAAIVIACLLVTLCPWRLRATVIVTWWATIVVLACCFVVAIASIAACFVTVVRTTSATTAIAAATIVLAVTAALLA
jgi:hypothetical protein